MTSKTLWISAMCLVFGATAYAAEHESGTQEQEAVPSMGQEVPATEHQAEALEQIEERFSELDQDGDGYLSQEEAAESPELAGYWDERGLGEDEKMDRADFAQFELEAETGVQEPGAVPSSEHQREAVEEVPPAAEPSGQ